MFRLIFPDHAAAAGLTILIFSFHLCDAALRGEALEQERIIDYLKLMFVAEKPPPSHVFEQVALMAAEERKDYF